jgi:stage II sporulation protein AA (anti-sigma F factor antagonist)
MIMIEQDTSCFSFKYCEGTLYAQISGEIDMEIASDWRDALDFEITKTRARNLAFDFSQVTFIDSSGLGVILGRYKKVERLCGKVMIHSVNETVYKILILSGFDKIMKIVPQIPMKKQAGEYYEI